MSDPTKPSPIPPGRKFPAIPPGIKSMHRLKDPFDPELSFHVDDCPGCKAENAFLDEAMACANCGCQEAGHGKNWADGSCDKHPLYCRGYWPRHLDRRKEHRNDKGWPERPASQG